jgi:hypothetical protein
MPLRVDRPSVDREDGFKQSESQHQATIRG